MAEMAIGYGSEYQLLRYLGHHRNYLFNEVCKITGSNNPISWLDYPVQLDRLSRDGELKGIECFQELPNYSEIKQAWEGFWPQIGNSHNWDGIFTQDDIWYFVEAKANLAEAKQRCGAGEVSRKQIMKAFESVTNNPILAKEWIDSDFYQLANRLAFVHFCKTQNIKAKVFYISFLNGYDVNPNKSVTNSKKWDECWQEQIKGLHLNDINEDIMNDICSLYIDCHTPLKK